MTTKQFVDKYVGAPWMPEKMVGEFRKELWTLLNSKYGKGYRAGLRQKGLPNAPIVRVGKLAPPAVPLADALAMDLPLRAGAGA